MIIMLEEASGTEVGQARLFCGAGLMIIVLEVGGTLTLLDPIPNAGTPSVRAQLGT
jgi:hypothetical protein